MNIIGTVHLAAAVAALASGAAVLLRRKGGTAHRRTGWVYAASMLTLNGTALAIYRLTGSFGPFHAAAFASMGTLVAGVLAVRRRATDPLAIERHYSFMSWSYVGLCAAAVSESASRLDFVKDAVRASGIPVSAFWTAVIVATIVVLATGSVLIRRNAPAMRRRFRPGAA
jgi:uncharacterized membrane protein